ncbi:MAG: PQQ-binding-like beta-propeller repeat protein [Planctomycetes bacterium]|nr:PQQ-binding-like beta-propeller repeat protein [Planctomycetota bacterium]
MAASQVFTMTPQRLCWRHLVALVLIAAPARAQEPAAVQRIVLPNLDSQVAARLIALDRRLNPMHSDTLAVSTVGQIAALPLNAFTPILTDARNQEIWEQMPDEYARLMQESGDALVTLPGAAPVRGVGWASEQVRRLCHQRLAALPKASLELYRRRVDAEARALLEQGRHTRSPIPLRKLANELFCSTHGEQAIDLLGDLAFEQGRFDEASHWWRLLAPLESTGSTRLLFPHPQLDPARIRAKQILALTFQNRRDEAQAALVKFRQMYPTARGKLAGQDGLLAEIVQKTHTAFTKEHTRSDEEPWTTFGGDVTRNRVDVRGVSWDLWEDGPAWRVPLPSLHADGKDALPDRGPATRRAAFHPIIVNNQVVIADQRSVISYDLTTGRENFHYHSKAVGLADLPPGVDVKAKMPRFTLTADHERAYVRLGRLGIGPKNDAASYLVCLDLTEPGVDKKRELWQVRASAADEAQAFFEGAPLVYDDRVYSAVSKVVGRRVLTSIACYDVRGRRRWMQEVCDCPEFEDGENGMRRRQHLLTWAAGQIVYASHAGAIVAVDAWTGQPTWGVRYPSRGPLVQDHEPSPRDLAPALSADGRVFVAPLDSDHIFCIDALSGRVLWEVEGVEVVHLLGVTRGELIATTRHGLLSIDAASGHIERMQPTEGRLPSLGRGLIADDWLLWPTQDPKQPYRAVSLREKDAPIFDPSRLHTLPVGNLAFGQGCLVIAGLDELVVYAPAHKARRLPPPDVRPEARMQQSPPLRLRNSPVLMVWDFLSSP